MATRSTAQPIDMLVETVVKSINTNLGLSIAEDDLLEELADGQLLCQLMNLYLKKLGRAAIPVKRGTAKDGRATNFKSFMEAASTLSLPAEAHFDVNIVDNDKGRNAILRSAWYLSLQIDVPDDITTPRSASSDMPFSLRNSGLSRAERDTVASSVASSVTSDTSDSSAPRPAPRPGSGAAFRPPSSSGLSRPPSGHERPTKSPIAQDKPVAPPKPAIPEKKIATASRKPTGSTDPPPVMRQRSATDLPPRPSVPGKPPVPIKAASSSNSLSGAAGKPVANEKPAIPTKPSTENMLASPGKQAGDRHSASSAGEESDSGIRPRGRASGLEKPAVPVKPRGLSPARPLLAPKPKTSVGEQGDTRPRSSTTTSTTTAAVERGGPRPHSSTVALASGSGDPRPRSSTVATAEQAKDRPASESEAMISSRPMPPSRTVKPSLLTTAPSTEDLTATGSADELERGSYASDSELTGVKPRPPIAASRAGKSISGPIAAPRTMSATLRSQSTPSPADTLQDLTPTQPAPVQMRAGPAISEPVLHAPRAGPTYSEPINTVLDRQLSQSLRAAVTKPTYSPPEPPSKAMSQPIPQPISPSRTALIPPPRQSPQTVPPQPSPRPARASLDSTALPSPLTPSTAGVPLSASSLTKLSLPPTIPLPIPSSSITEMRERTSPVPPDGPQPRLPKHLKESIERFLQGSETGSAPQYAAPMPPSSSATSVAPPGPYAPTFPGSPDSSRRSQIEFQEHISIMASELLPRLKAGIRAQEYKVIGLKFDECFRGQQLLDFLTKDGVTRADAEAVCVRLSNTRAIVRAANPIANFALAALDKTLGTLGAFSKSAWYRWADDRPGGSAAGPAAPIAHGHELTAFTVPGSMACCECAKHFSKSRQVICRRCRMTFHTKCVPTTTCQSITIDGSGVDVSVTEPAGEDDAGSEGSEGFDDDFWDEEDDEADGDGGSEREEEKLEEEKIYEEIDDNSRISPSVSSARGVSPAPAASAAVAASLASSLTTSPAAAAAAAPATTSTPPDAAAAGRSPSSIRKSAQPERQQAVRRSRSSRHGASLRLDYKAGSSSTEMQESAGLADFKMEEIYVAIEQGSLEAASPPKPPAETSEPPTPVAAVKSALWRDRPEVVAAGLAATLPKGDVKRQEAICELIASEAVYLTDVKILRITWLLAMDAYVRAREFKNMKLVMPRKVIDELKERAAELDAIGNEMLAQLTARQAETPVVSTISDILTRFSNGVREKFMNYCVIATEANSCVDAAELKELSTNYIVADASTRRLPFSAFLLAPIQRLARYPLLLKAIQSATPDEHPDNIPVRQAYETYTTLVEECNERLRVVEARLQLKKIESDLDVSRLKSPIPLVAEHRSLIKRGAMQMLTIDRKKVTKSRLVELMLFTDLFMYGQPVKVSKTGDTKYIVFKQMHRSLVRLADPRGEGPVRDDLLLQLILYDKTSFGTVTTIDLYIRANSMTDKTRWLEAFNPVREDDNIYEIWDRPRAKVLYEYAALQTDELSLTPGDTLEIIQHDEQWSKGMLCSTTAVGWFPTSYVQELDGVHAEARKFKKLMQGEA
eukprot:m.32365 g.32365  ORF g.32365 m.32365 type:complete len:1566 (-) comp4989_c0_seq1:149-4846(-)